MKNINTFAKLLQKYRFEKKLSREQLAELLKVHSMTVYRWESGRNNPEPEERKRIEDFINNDNIFIDPYELLMQEIILMQEKLDSLKDYLKRFHD